MKVRGRRGLERALLWLAAVLLSIVFAQLAAWQYGRAQWKADYLDAWQQALDTPRRPLRSDDLDTAVTVPAAIEARLQHVSGTPWLLLDNQRREAAIGVRLYAAYRFAGAGPALLVDFGWLAMPPDRQLPALPPPPSAVEAEGMLMPWPGQALAVADNPWPGRATAAVLLTYLERAEISRELGVGLVEGMLRVTRLGDDGAAAPLPALARDALALPNTLSPEQHRGYALQWAGLALTVLVVALILTLRRRST